MKKYIYFIAVVLLTVSCTKDRDFRPVVNPDATIKDAGLIAFKVIPLSATEVEVAFPNTTQSQPLTKIILRDDTAVPATLPISVTSAGVLSATFTYAFHAGKKYNFLVQAAASSRTIKQYHIAEYIHQYLSQYTYQKILSLKQSLGINTFDLSPSRNYLFITDYVIIYFKLNGLICKRLLLKM